MQIRRPAVAGQFYPEEETSLRKTISDMTVSIAKKIEAIGVVSPHAGYMYSGKVACSVFSNIEIPQTVIILGPNHTGTGSPYSIYAAGRWQLPMGEIEIAEDLAEMLVCESSLIMDDPSAHRDEHSIEVQVPFLQYFNPKVKIVPIAIGGFELKEFDEVGRAIASCIKKYKKDVLIVASSDMTHYESQEDAKRKDDFAISAILNLDEREMLTRIEEKNISMCGYAPVAIMLISAKLLGAKEAKLIKYTTSGDVTGDYSSVVGYAGLAVY